MEQRNDHPLDVDLLAHVLGEPISPTNALEGHLGDCLLCRVRAARLRRSLPADQRDDGVPEALVAPAVPAAVRELLAEPAARPEPAPSQLWLASRGTSRLLVWLRAVRAADAIVHPVVLDVDAVDDSGLIVEVPAIGMTAAVVTSLVGNVPLTALDRYVEVLDVADDAETVRQAQITKKTEHDLRVGAPLSGPADERLEARQLIADELAALAEPDVDADDEPDGAFVPPSPTRELFEHVAQSLPDRRGPQCAVAPPTDDRLVAFALRAGWDLVATITELTCTVVVFATEHPVDDVLAHQSSALRLTDLTDATTIAAVGWEAPHPTALFERPDLLEALETPRAGPNTVGPRPWNEPLPMLDALFKYLERRALVSEIDAEPTATAPTVDRHELFERHARQAIADLRTTRAQRDKRLALHALSDADADVVASSIAESEDVDELLRRLRGEQE